MKKFLSLVLALVMTMSLVTVSAGAKDYADADKITYVEAVDVLSTLGVLEGDANGFRPNDTLKRSEAAKIICALNLTPKTAAKLSADSAPFADVAKSHWAAGYIAEGVASGIIAGVGGNMFAPDAELTGYAFLKMLLVSLGYDATVEGMTGANWSIAVAKLADDLELTKGNDEFVGSAAVTREEAALYALNTLKTLTVSYANKGTQITVDGVVISTGASAAQENKTTFMEENYKKLDVDTEDYDAVGRPSNTWTYDGEEIDTYADAADYVLIAEEDTTLAELIEDNDLDKKITTFDDEDLNTGDVVELWVSKKAVTDQAIYHYELVEVTDVEEIDEEDELAEDYGAAYLYTLETENDEILVKEYVDALSESKSGYQDIGEFEEDDILIAAVNYKNQAVAFALAETVTGEMTARGTNYVKIDGTKYVTVTNLGKGMNFDDTFTLYLDANGIALAKDTAEEADEDLEYVYVLKVNAQNEDENLITSDEAAAKVKVMYLDGEIEVLDYALDTDDDYFKFCGEKYTYDPDTTLASIFKSTVKTGWYAYTLNDDGEITLKSANQDDESTVKTVSIYDEQREIASGIYASTSTVVTVLDSDGIVKTYTSYKNFPKTKIEMSALVIFGTSTSRAAEVYIYDADAEEDTETIDVALFVKTGDETSDGVECTFYVEGEKVTYVVEDKPATTAGQLFEIELDEDDIATITALDEDDYVKGTTDVVSDDYVVLTNGKEVSLDDDCAVYQVSKNGKTVTSADLDEDVDVIIILNSDGDATEIFMYKDITILD